MKAEEKKIVETYQEGAVEAIVLLRFNLWEELTFEDLTPTVRATISKVEDRINRSREALIRACAFDPYMGDTTVTRITSERIIPHETGRLPRDQ